MSTNDNKALSIYSKVNAAQGVRQVNPTPAPTAPSIQAAGWNDNQVKDDGYIPSEATVTGQPRMKSE